MGEMDIVTVIEFTSRAGENQATASAGRRHTVFSGYTEEINRVSLEVLVGANGVQPSVAEMVEENAKYRGEADVSYRKPFTQLLSWLIISVVY